MLQPGLARIALDNAILQVNDEKCGVRSMLECGHQVPVSI